MYTKWEDNQSPARDALVRQRSAFAIYQTRKPHPSPRPSTFMHTSWTSSTAAGLLNRGSSIAHRRLS